MTKREFERRQHLTRALQALGFTEQEVESLRRISNTLRRWHELECGTDSGCIEWPDDGVGAPYWMNAHSGKSYRIPDRETGAKKRLFSIMGARNSRAAAGGIDALKTQPLVMSYIQTDPRGAALYILRPGDVPAGADVSAYYSRGICVY